MKLDIKNFRSIKDQSVELAPITVLYGPNGSGKSSLLYSLLVMQNLVRNPTGGQASRFNLGFSNLGGFYAVVHGHKDTNNILLRVSLTEQSYPVVWSAAISKGTVTIHLQIHDVAKSTTFSPHLNLSSSLESITRRVPFFEGYSFDFIWNGIEASVQPVHQDNVKIREAAEKFKTIAEAPIELLRKIGVAPMQAGFTKPRFTEVEGLPSLYDEDAIGTFLRYGPYLESDVSGYLEKITGREFRVHSYSRDNQISLEVTDRSVENHRYRVPTEIVNDGFGINRIAWMLACTLFNNTTLMCIEEPETHLHPSSVRRLAKVFVEIMREEGKRFLLTTHSETLVLALLAEVSRGNLKPDELAFYLTRKEGVQTNFQRQEVNELGQVEGGLSSFMEGEMEDIAAFFEQKS